jgi:hypothetical protein
MAERKRSRGGRKASRQLPDTAYPAPVPLGRSAALAVLDRLEEFDATVGAFLTFVQVPIGEREGEWRFAGVGDSLAAAVRQVEAFADALQFPTMVFPDREYNGLLRFLLDENGEGDEYSYPQKAPVPVTGPHRLVLCVRYGAPYEGLGVCVVEIPALAGSPYGRFLPETDFPEQWREQGADWLLEQGAERFGPAPAEVEAAIRAETRTEVWAGWLRDYKDARGWQELVAGSSRGRRGGRSPKGGRT